MMTQGLRRARAAAVLSVLSVLLGSCASEPDPDPRPLGATVGVLLTGDLPDAGWIGPRWDYEDAVADVGSGTPLPRYRCRVADVAATGWGSSGLVAQASAGWSTRDDSAAVVRSVANRYGSSEDTERLQETLDDLLGRCTRAGEQGESRVVVAGTEQAPVIDEVHYDEMTSTAWRMRTTWTTLPGEVFVQVTSAWLDGHEAPVDVEELLSVAVERAETLPQTSPHPGDPPACEDC